MPADRTQHTHNMQTSSC